ncbi:cathelicidin antimicrobial peptide isoform X1 [Talpa occidentalis]|uniref:cathelicidin antimicrobial peptide isoform X1 n=1 Tax=Talpa occidentalis TaxID=50954 RepID=UPI0018901F2A|nr:cathelicidin antimicrobial peptide isoform X1 [Talpa occidentalis]
METQRDSPSLGWWSLVLLLLGLLVPPATTQDLGYQEAVLRAVEGLNQRSPGANLYRLLELDQEPKGDDDPNNPKPVSFLVKETVCPWTMQQSPEQCDFKEQGLVKQCVGTVSLDQIGGSFDITCDEPRSVKLFGKVGNLLQKGWQKIKNIGRRIKDFFRNIRPMQEA